MDQSTIEAPDLQAIRPNGSVSSDFLKRNANRLKAHGANFTRMLADSKEPDGKWSRLKNEHQKQRDELDLDDVGKWNRVQRLGIVSAVGGIRCFDFDAGDEAVNSFAVAGVLGELGLPSDYPWKLRSKSGKGWHVFVKCDEPLPAAFANGVAKSVYIGTPKHAGAFKQLELRWQGCHTVLGPSNDPEWHVPETDMATVSATQIVRAFERVAILQTVETAKRSLRAANLNRPGDDFNAYGDSRPILEKHGWTLFGLRGDVEDWRKPGSTSAHAHGTLNHGSIRGLFYVFSTDAPPFEADRAYTPFQVFALLEHNDDFVAAAAALRAVGYGKQYGDAKSYGETGATYRDADYAKWLIEDFGHSFRYVEELKRFAIFNGNRWVIDTSEKRMPVFVSKLVGELTAALKGLKKTNGESDDDFKQRRNDLAAGIERAKDTPIANRIVDAITRDKDYDLIISRTDFDADPWLFNLQNGTLVLRPRDDGSFELQEHDPADLLTQISPVNFDPTAKAPKFEKFIREVFDNNARVIAYVQQALGYALTGRTTEQAMWMAFGKGSNGKSTLINTMLAVFGGYGKTANFATFEQRQRNDLNNDLETLNGKRFVAALEGEQGTKLAEARMKSITGGDAIDSRKLYGEFYNHRPQYSVWLAFNHFPIIDGSDDAIGRRIKVIKFNQKFVAPEKLTDEDRANGVRVKNLKLESELIAEELPGILNWMLDGLRAWFANGERLIEPPEITEWVDEYRASMDSLRMWLDECCVLGKNQRAPAKDLHDSYRAYMEEQGDENRKLAEKNFYNRLAERSGIEKSRNKRGMTYHGIRLKTDEERGRASNDADASLSKFERAATMQAAA